MPDMTLHVDDIDELLTMLESLELEESDDEA